MNASNNDYWVLLFVVSPEEYRDSRDTASLARGISTFWTSRRFRLGNNSTCCGTVVFAQGFVWSFSIRGSRRRRGRAWRPRLRPTAGVWLKPGGRGLPGGGQSGVPPLLGTFDFPIFTDFYRCF